MHAPPAALVGGRFPRDEPPPARAPLRQRVLHYYKWFLRRVYPSVNAAYYFAVLAFNVTYLFSNTAYASPLLWLVRTRVRRLNAADYHAIALASEKAALGRTPRRGSLLNPRNVAQSIVPGMLSGLKLALPASIFALKFLEWWHASDFGRQLLRKASKGLELPPPIVTGLPEPEAKSQEQPHNEKTTADPPGEKTKEPMKSALKVRKPKPPIAAGSRLSILTVPAPTPSTSALCPICLKDIVNPTAAQTGFVFCYPCIFRWVDGTHDRQIDWMQGRGGGEGWGDEEADEAEEAEKEPQQPAQKSSREGKWESGQGRCAVTGRRLLGATGALRRVIV